MYAVPMIAHLVARHALPATRQKDVVTSVRKLAAALDVNLDALDLGSVERTYRETLKSYFAGLSPQPSPHTQRNTFQNLAQLYRGAHTLGLLRSTVPAKAARPSMRTVLEIAAHESPYRYRTGRVLPGYYCRKGNWPEDIRRHWEAYRSERSFELREPTFAKTESHLCGYLGYHTATNIPLPTWDQLFEVARLRRFVQWHAAHIDMARDQEDGRKGPKTRSTALGVAMVKAMLTWANYVKHPEADAILSLLQKLPVPERWHHKEDPMHTVSLRELDDLGLKLLSDARQPTQPPRPSQPQKYPRMLRAILCQTGLLIRLWWRVPLRNRSMREMDITLPGMPVPHPRLYRDEQGLWQLRYQGEQLKIRERRGRTNEFRVPFPPDLVPHLEEYLREFRPRLPNADRDPHLFLTAAGTPFSGPNLRKRLFTTIYYHLGRRVYPHLLRTLWTDAFLLNTGGDVDTAAYMLNDSVVTVLKHYHEIRADQQVLKAYAFNEAVLGNGQGKGRHTS